MKITDIKMYTAQVPLAPLTEGGISPYVGSKDLQAGTDAGTTHALSCLFKVETDEGLYGWGEMNPVISLDIHRLFLRDFIKPMLIGADPYDISLHMERFAGVYHPQINAKTFLTGVEIACWDLMGKAAGRPVHQLLGGAVRDRMKIAYCLGMQDLDATRDKIRQIRAGGFGCVKTKGGNDVLFDIQRTRVIREAGGEDLELRMDVNGSYDPISALHYLRQVEDCNLQYIEQPLPIGSLTDMCALRNRVGVPLAINEDCYMPGNFLAFVRAGAIDAAVMDMEQLGGIGEIVKMAALARQAGVPLAHHCGFDMGLKTAAILQVVCACPAFTYATDSTYHAHADDILTERLTLQEGCLLLPRGPGLGVEVDEEKLEKYKLESTPRRFI